MARSATYNNTNEEPKSKKRHFFPTLLLAITTGIFGAKEISKNKEASEILNERAKTVANQIYQSEYQFLTSTFKRWNIYKNNRSVFETAFGSYERVHFKEDLRLVYVSFEELRKSIVEYNRRFRVGSDERNQMKNLVYVKYNELVSFIEKDLNKKFPGNNIVLERL